MNADNAYEGDPSLISVEVESKSEDSQPKVAATPKITVKCND